jgi:hypothetical protein
MSNVKYSKEQIEAALDQWFGSREMWAEDAFCGAHTEDYMRDMRATLAAASVPAAPSDGRVLLSADRLADVYLTASDDDGVLMRAQQRLLGSAQARIHALEKPLNELVGHLKVLADTWGTAENGIYRLCARELRSYLPTPAPVPPNREQCEAAARADERAHWVDQFKGAADYAEDSADLIRRYEDIVARLRKEGERK